MKSIPVTCRPSLLAFLLWTGACGTAAKPSPARALPAEAAPPKVAHREKPTYPADGRGFEASVVVKAGVDKTGRVRTVEVIRSGGSMFDDAARDAMFRTTFVPGEAAGRPVDCYITFTFNFKQPPSE